MRKLKEIRTAKFQDVTYNGKWGFHSNYPFLRLSGRWLEDAGFKIYETCQIKVSKNRILITKIKPAKNDTRNENSTSKRTEAKNMEKP